MTHPIKSSNQRTLLAPFPIDAEMPTLAPDTESPTILPKRLNEKLLKAVKNGDYDQVTGVFEERRAAPTLDTIKQAVDYAKNFKQRSFEDLSDSTEPFAHKAWELTKIYTFLRSQIPTSYNSNSNPLLA